MKRKEQPSGFRYALVIIGLALLTIWVLDFNSRMAELRRLEREKESVSARVTAVVQTQDELRRQVAYATSEAAVMRWAYEDGHMARPGDDPVVPIQPAEFTPAPTPTPTPTPTEAVTWNSWLELFFGD